MGNKVFLALNLTERTQRLGKTCIIDSTGNSGETAPLDHLAFEVQIALIQSGIWQVKIPEEFLVRWFHQWCCYVENTMGPKEADG